MSEGSPFQQLADALVELRHDFASTSPVGPLFDRFFATIKRAATDAHYPLVRNTGTPAFGSRKPPPPLDGVVAMTEPTDFVPSPDFDSAKRDRLVARLAEQNERATARGVADRAKLDAATKRHDEQTIADALAKSRTLAGQNRRAKAVRRLSKTQRAMFSRLINTPEGECSAAVDGWQRPGWYRTAASLERLGLIDLAREGVTQRATFKPLASSRVGVAR